MGWLQQILSPSNANKYTLAHLKSLHSTLSRTPVNERNKALIVESMRSMAELLIWGDKNDPSFFEFFLENNVLAVFWNILAHSHSLVQIKVQLVQTLSILIQNIEAGPSVYYILSNDHINNLIRHPFDLSNEVHAFRVGSRPCV
eukprot:3889123-Pleurochrysis_carterae.AAC.1